MDLGERSGNRAVGIGEIPYFDPQSQSRAEALGLAKPGTKATTNGVNNYGMDHEGYGGRKPMIPGGHGMMAHGDLVMSNGR